MTALTGEELLAWVERTNAGWRALAAEHPEMLELPCDIRETRTIAEFLQHIVAVELRYAERLHGLPQTAYEDIPFGSGEQIFSTHGRAVLLLRQLMADGSFDWEETIEFATRSAGTLRASRRTILVHLLLHSIRHYAQLATLIRQHGMEADWSMDYLFMSAEAVKTAE